MQRTFDKSPRQAFVRNGLLGAGAAFIEVPPWLPSDMPNVQGWWDASDAGTVVLTGGKVSQWSSKVGANHFIQGTDSRRPTVSANTLNGKALIDHSGVTQWMDLTTRLTNVRSVFILCKWRDTSGSYRALFGDSSTFDFHGPASGSDLLSGSTSGNVLNSSKYVDGVLTSGYLSKFLTWKQLGFVAAGNFTIGAFSQDRGGIYGDRGFNGDVAEIVMMSGAATDADRILLQNYWAAKYAL